MATQTSPLNKAITTLEGRANLGITALLAVAAEPSIHALNPKVAAICISVTQLGLLAQRGLIKIKALQSTAVVQTILDSPDPLGTAGRDLKLVAAAPTDASVKAELGA